MHVVRARLAALITITALLAAAIGSTAAGAADADPVTLTNGGFETGDLTGWTTNLTCEGGPCDIDESVGVVDQLRWSHDTRTAPSGRYFAIVFAGCQDNSISQQFTAQAGQVLAGSAFFASDESGDDATHYIDSGRVEILQGSQVIATLFESDVSVVGSEGTGPWTPFQYTVPADGEYTVRVTSTNFDDCASDSVVGVDFGAATNSLIVTPDHQLFGYSVTITAPNGGLTGTTAVLMDGVPTEFVVLNDSTISASVTEQAGVGLVDLTVVTPSGAIVTPSAFTAVAPVIVTLPSTTPTPPPTSTATPTPTGTATPTPTETPTPVDQCPTTPIDLSGAATLTTWPGPDGATIASVVADCQDGEFADVTAIWTFDSATQQWSGWFANAGDVAGANDITEFTTGTAYFFLKQS